MGKKIKKQKFTKKQEQIYLKDFFIYTQTTFMLQSIGLDEELYDFIRKNFDLNILAESSEYGYELFNLNFLNFLNQEKCFLCFIKLDIDEYLERMLIYRDELKQVA
jgi:hypothetical protein